MNILVHLFHPDSDRTACGVQYSPGQPKDQIVTCGACKRTNAYKRFTKGPLPPFPEDTHPVRFT